MNRKIGLKLGFDISITSATKYYSGHSDVMAGTVAVNKKVYKKVSESFETVFNKHRRTQGEDKKSNISNEMFCRRIN